MYRKAKRVRMGGEIDEILTLKFYFSLSLLYIKW